MFPWSVMPSAGCPSAAAAATTSSTRAAPSSIENSVWTWRWVKLSPTGISLVLPAGVPQLFHNGGPPTVEKSHGCDFARYQVSPRARWGLIPMPCRAWPADHVVMQPTLPYDPSVTPPRRSGLRVQNLLLGLGTGLVAVAAVVFVAVNWSRLDATVQAGLLFAVTGAAAAATAALARRQMPATAEALGLVTVLLALADAHAVHV